VRGLHRRVYSRRRSSGAEQAAHNRCVGGSSPPAATKGAPRRRPFGIFSREGLNRAPPRADSLPEMTTTRYCTTCAAEVEDAGGFCMLGHRLAPAVPSIDEFQSEFEGAFEEARAQISGPTPAVPTPPPPPPPSQRPSVWDELDDEPVEATDPITSFAPAPRMDWGPDRNVLSRVEGLFNRPQRPSRASA
jgi:hypothetical protein